ncbi:hypothetical protein GGR58DRAFT_496664 [Xylaria digitata]|nr:hypothetical protein GGR58DRAFT_496664 [Xylaria digitata]
MSPIPHNHTVILYSPLSFLKRIYPPTLSSSSLAIAMPQEMRTVPPPLHSPPSPPPSPPPPSLPTPPPLRNPWPRDGNAAPRVPVPRKPRMDAQCISKQWGAEVRLHCGDVLKRGDREEIYKYSRP